MKYKYLPVYNRKLNLMCDAAQIILGNMNEQLYS